jgi:hypothetical protein
VTGAAGQLKRHMGQLVYTARMNVGGKPAPRAAQSLCRVSTVVFSGSCSVLMGPYARTTDEEVSGQTAAIALQALPKLPPDTPSFPTSAAGVDCIPVARLPRQMPPGSAGAGDREHRLNEEAITPVGRTASLVCDGIQPRCNLSPNGVGDEQAYGHRRSPPGVDDRGDRMPKPRIRQHTLVGG